MGDLRCLVREGSANMFIGLEPLVVYSYTLQGLWPFFLSQHSEGYFCLGSGNLGPEVLGKLIQDQS